jgi:hypothetical protein
MTREIPNLTVIFPARRSHPESRITAAFTPMGENLYRMDEGFLCGPVYFGDVIEALPTDEKDTVLFQRRVKKAGLRRDCYVIPSELVEKPRFAELMNEIEDLGGYSAVDFGGLFLVFLPKTSDLDINLELGRVAGISKWKRRYLHFQSGLKQRLQRYWKTTRSLKTEN